MCFLAYTRCNVSLWGLIRKVWKTELSCQSAPWEAAFHNSFLLLWIKSTQYGSFYLDSTHCAVSQGRSNTVLKIGCLMRLPWKWFIFNFVNLILEKLKYQKQKKKHVKTSALETLQRTKIYFGLYFGWKITNLWNNMQSPLCCRCIFKLLLCHDLS